MTTVPCFRICPAPLTLRSLTRATESPSASTLPAASRTSMLPAVAAMAAISDAGRHSPCRVVIDVVVVLICHCRGLNTVRCQSDVGAGRRSDPHRRTGAHLRDRQEPKFERRPSRTSLAGRRIVWRRELNRCISSRMPMSEFIPGWSFRRVCCGLNRRLAPSRPLSRRGAAGTRRSRQGRPASCAGTSEGLAPALPQADLARLAGSGP